MAKQNYKDLKKEVGSLFPNQLLAFTTAVLTIVLQTYLIIEMQRLIDLVVANKSIDSLIIRFLISIVLFFILNIVSQYTFRILNALGKNKLLLKIYYNLLEKDISFFEKKDTGNLISIILNDGDNVADWLSRGWLIRSIQLVSLLISISVMFYYSITLTLIIILLIAVCFVFVNIVSKEIAKITENLFEIKGTISQNLMETIQSISIIKMLKKENYFQEKFSNIITDDKYPLDKKHSILFSLYMSVTIVLMQLMPLIAVGIGIVLVSKNKLTIGSIVSIYALTGRLQEPVRILAESISQEKSDMRLVDRLSIFLPDKQDSNKLQVKQVNDISVDIDEFTYDNENYMLKDIKLNADSNSGLILIKGESGIGKSTLANLMVGITDIKSGQIKINNIDINHLKKDSLWDSLLLKGQENLIIKGTVYENIALGDKYSESEIYEVIETVCLDDFIKKYGLNSQLEEKGDNLSGGQKQRINLARVLIRKPKILILDEPTSSLDEETSTEISKNIVNYSKKNNITLIIITHKNDFDRYANEEIHIC